MITQNALGAISRSANCMRICAHRHRETAAYRCSRVEREASARARGQVLHDAAWPACRGSLGLREERRGERSRGVQAIRAIGRYRYMFARWEETRMRIQSFVSALFAIAICQLAACGGDDGDSDLSCDSYCTSIMANCSGTNQQFGSMEQCMSSCSHYPVGKAEDTTGNTLGCRTYHAGSPAKNVPAEHCIHAGPGGAGPCGSNCEGFCTLVLGSCTGANAQYGGDMNTCMAACSGFAVMPLYSTSQTSGNTLSCRLYHASVASEMPDTHCAHTAVTSAPCK